MIKRSLSHDRAADPDYGDDRRKCESKSPPTDEGDDETGEEHGNLYKSHDFSHYRSDIPKLQNDTYKHHSGFSG
jgi:hypothetical protein